MIQNILSKALSKEGIYSFRNIRAMSSSIAAIQSNEAKTDNTSDISNTNESSHKSVSSRKRCTTSTDDAVNIKRMGVIENDAIEVQDACPFRKKKVALLLVYSGKGYMGMQKNPGFRTIESDLQEALVKAGVVRPDHIEQPGVKMGFQRAARTDKGVSAAGQVVSLKMLVDIEDPVGKINEHLPAEIRVLGLKRTTKGFDAKNSCNSRTYIYVIPTFSFASSSEEVTTNYKITEEQLSLVQEILNKYKGSHNFHNYTSGKKPNDPSARRYIMDFTVGRPFERSCVEYLTLTVRGQSFMLHQIRKMIGLTIAICRGFLSMEVIERSWESERVDIPKAPGLGLVLDQLHYDGYNKKFGNDGVHEAIKWDNYEEKINEFKEKVIFPVIFTSENEDKIMLQWLSTLEMHNFMEGQKSEKTKTLENNFCSDIPNIESNTNGDSK